MDDQDSRPNCSLKTDWTHCVICQEKNNEPLQCPANSKHSDVGAGYKTLACNIQKLANLGYMPVEINISRLDEGDGIEETFSRCTARWHRSCYALFNSTKFRRAEKRHSSQHGESIGEKFTRSNVSGADENTCFLCEEIGSKPLHSVSTLGLDARVRDCASVLEDEKLLVYLSGGDLIAVEAKYHAHCLSLLYRKAQHAKDEVVGEVSDKPHRLDGIALAELVSYIDDSCTSDTTKLPVFKLADLARMYQSCRQQLSTNSETRVNTSRLKERILMHVPELEAYNKGRDIYLALKKDVGAVLQKVHMEDCDEEAMHLAKTAAILRKDMFANKYSFTGSFEPHSQANSIPASLLSFVNMVLYGPNIETQTHSSSKGQAGLTISQLLQYNSYLRRRDGEVKHERRNKSRETPLPIYSIYQFMQRLVAETLLRICTT